MHCTYLSGGAAVVTEWKHATAYYSTYTYPAAAPPQPPPSSPYPAPRIHSLTRWRRRWLRTKWIFIKINAGQTKTTLYSVYPIISSRPAPTHLVVVVELLLLLLFWVLLYNHKIIPHIKFPFCASLLGAAAENGADPRMEVEEERTEGRGITWKTSFLLLLY